MESNDYGKKPRRFLSSAGFFCNPKTMGYAHGSKKAEADE